MDRDHPSTEPLGHTISMQRLRDIAAALGLSPEAFASPVTLPGERAHIIAENAEALYIFAGITDPKARAQALAYLRWIAEQTAVR